MRTWQTSRRWEFAGPPEGHVVPRAYMEAKEAQVRENPDFHLSQAMEPAALLQAIE